MTPYNPTSFEVESDNGNFVKDVKKIKLHFEPEQRESYIGGEILAKRMKDKGMNSNTLKYLLDNQKEIPEEWKGKYIYFFGTILRRSDGNRYVLYLCWRGGEWDWLYGWLGHVWRAGRPSAVLAEVSLDSETKNSLDPLNLELRVKSLEEDMEKIKKFLIK